MTQHTPGPWSVGLLRRSSSSAFSCPEVPIHVGALGVGYGQGNALAIVYLGGPGAIQATNEAVLANANAIAAVPDLLAACESFVASYKSLQREKCDVAHRMAVAAIAKAKGLS